MIVEERRPEGEEGEHRQSRGRDHRGREREWEEQGERVRRTGRVLGKTEGEGADREREKRERGIWRERPGDGKNIEGEEFGGEQGIEKGGKTVRREEAEKE